MKQITRTTPGILWPALVLSLALAACGMEDDLADDEGDWTNDDAFGQLFQAATCPNGGKTTPIPPVFGSSIDGYASYVGQTKCDPTAKPGVVAFMNLVLKTYPCTASYGIVRGCSVGGTSEHKEGRAWDWKLNYPHPAATSFLAWLLATDKAGHKHAMARRLGVMYMVWNNRIWKSYQASAGWQSYSGSNPHTDHVHFSFSWAGALKKTSYWSAPANVAPKGKLEQVSCSTIKGWAYDSNAGKSPIDVRVYIDKLPGGTGGFSAVVKANAYRSDLCSALGSCSHGFSLALPSKFIDGKNHTVRAYAVDSTSGATVQLTGSPKSVTCKPPTTDAGTPKPSDGGVPDPDSAPEPEGGTPAFEADAGAPVTADADIPNGGNEGEEPGVEEEAMGSCSVAGRAAPGTGLPLLLLLGVLARLRRRRRPA